MTSIARFYTLASEGTLEELDIPELRLRQREQPMGSDQTGRGDDRLSRPLDDRPFGRHPASSGNRAHHSQFRRARRWADIPVPGRQGRSRSVRSWRGGPHPRSLRLPRRARRQYLAAADFARLYRGISGSGGDDGTFKVDEIAIENIDGRQPEKPMTDVWDHLMDPDDPARRQERPRCRRGDRPFFGLARRHRSAPTAFRSTCPRTT